VADCCECFDARSGSSATELGCSPTGAISRMQLVVWNQSHFTLAHWRDQLIISCLLYWEMSSDEEDIIVMWWFINHKKRRASWVHPYMKRNFNRRVFIAATELSQDDRKFQLFYRMSKESFTEVFWLVGAVITKKDTNCRQCIWVEESLLITLCKPKYLFTTVYFKLQIFVNCKKCWHSESFRYSHSL
jgi:hypothetical protein